MLPPQNVQENLDRFVALRPDLEDDLRNAVDVPCKVLLCKEASREFLACEYNREGVFYRSPWSGTWYSLEGEPKPVVADSDVEAGTETQPVLTRLQKMEQVANKAFDSYRNLYFDGGISSVYLWDTTSADEDPAVWSFGAAVLIKKAVDPDEPLKTACWDSIHVFEMEETSPKTLSLRLTSTVILSIEGAFPGLDDFRLGGNMTRQHEQTLAYSLDTDIVAGMGRVVEEVEGRMRSALQEIYFGKTLEIVNGIRPSLPEGYLRNQNQFREDLRSHVAATTSI